MKKSRPRKMTIEEASDFFDEHDVFESGDVSEVTDIKFDLTKKHYIGIDPGLYKKIKSRAKSLQVHEDALINEWLAEKVG